jgi:acetyl esterase/lipase
MAARQALQLAIEISRFSRRKRRPAIVDLGRLAELQAQFEELAGDHQIAGDSCFQAANAGGVSAEWLGGPNLREDSAILYLHGGCYATGSVETHRDLMSRLSRAASMRVLGLNYRLAPVHPFPAAVEDATAAYRWLLEIGIEPARIAFAGDSAGAGLALAATIVMRDVRVPLPGAIVCISPWVDLAVTGASMESNAYEDPIVSREMLLGWGKLYLGDRDPRITSICGPAWPAADSYSSWSGRGAARRFDASRRTGLNFGR